MAAVGLAACAIFPPLGDEAPSRVDLDWAQPLYELEPFAYRPVELGRPLFVQSSATEPAGMLIVPSKDRAVRGVDVVSGRVLWTLVTRGANVAQPVAIGEEFVFGSTDGQVYRANQRNGRVLWASEYPGKSVVAPVAIADGRIFATSIDNRVSALSYETGERLWDKRRPHASEFTMTGQAGPLVHQGRVITGFSDGQLVAFEVEDGATAWVADLSGGKTEFVDVDTTPVVVDGVLVASSYRHGLYGLDPDSGTVLWLVKGEAFGTPATLDGILYVPQANGRLVAVGAKDGDVRWVSRFFSEKAATPAATTKYLLLPIGESLALIDRGSGRTLLRYDDGRGVDATPEFAFGTAYVLGNSGTLYALGIY